MAEPLKDRFGRLAVEHLAEHIEGVHPSFDRLAFVEVTAAFPDLELKARVDAVADQLARLLPPDYRSALEIVVATALEGGFEGFSAWPLCTFVERHGVGNHVESLAAMETLTRAWSCEFAIRPFLEHHLEPTMRSVHQWSSSDSADVRRLASEGTRPLLPWARRVQALLDDPQLGLSVLERLRRDPSETVRRSVANHLNDISKNHPDLVAETVARWSRMDGVDPKMIRHALRTLIKKGHKGAMGTLGFTTDASIEVESFEVTPPELNLGESIDLRARVTSTSADPQHLVIDFVIHHPSARGPVSTKVFKWTTLDLDGGASVTLNKSRKIATASTRRYTAGRHNVDLQIAGLTAATTSFDLLDSSRRPDT